MRKFLTKFLDKTFWIYVGLGFLNYFFCSAVMLIFRNVLNVPEDPCLYIAFFLQTTISFILNRYVTFRGIRISRLWQLKFVVSVGTSYLVAKVLLKKLFYELIELPFFAGISDWLQKLVRSELSTARFRQSLVMLACTFIYCVINYIGQRYFVFRPRKPDTECPSPQACRTDAG